MSAADAAKRKGQTAAAEPQHAGAAAVPARALGRARRAAHRPLLPRGAHRALPLLLVAVVDVLTMSRARRIRLQRQSGATWQAIATRHGVSRSTVRRWSAA